ncbi:hypothetical protein JCM11641_000947 [Rhodosporidiobolus odoratus]
MHFAELLSDDRTRFSWSTLTCWFCGSTSLFMGVVLAVFATLYIYPLRAQIVRAGTSMSPTGRAIRTTRRWLVVTTVAFSVVFIVLASTFLWIAALGDTVFISSIVNMLEAQESFPILLGYRPSSSLRLAFTSSSSSSSSSRNVSYPSSPNITTSLRPLQMCGPP